MCDMIRLELRKESLKFEQYAKITAYVSKIAKELFSQKINLEEVQQYFNIINHLKMDLRNEQYRRNR